MRLVGSFGSEWPKGGSGALKYMSPSTHWRRAIEKQSYAADSHGGSFTPLSPQWTYDMTSDEEVGRQILNIFMKHHVGVNGVLRRNNFVEVRDAGFQRGLNKAVENRWIKIKLRDRYTYELTEAGLAAGLNAGLPSKPSV